MSKHLLGVDPNKSSPSPSMSMAVSPAGVDPTIKQSFASSSVNVMAHWDIPMSCQTASGIKVRVGF